MTIGDNIKKYRKHSNLTQKELGELIGKSTISIRKYEANDITPSLKVLDDISKALNVNIRELTNNNDNEFDEFIDAVGIDKINLAMELMKRLDPNVVKALNETTLNTPFDEMEALKNKYIFKKELDNKEMLYDKIDPKQLELIYLSKIDDLNRIIETQEMAINKLKDINNKLFSLLGGVTNGE